MSASSSRRMVDNQRARRLGIHAVLVIARAWGIDCEGPAAARALDVERSVGRALRQIAGESLSPWPGRSSSGPGDPPPGRAAPPAPGGRKNALVGLLVRSALALLRGVRLLLGRSGGR